MPGHVPVLRQEAVRLLVTDPGGTYLDATLGLGGHSREIVAALGGEEARVIAMDCDPAAVERARANPPAPPHRFTAVRGRFSEIDQVLGGLGITGVHGLLADLGISSDQLDDPARGLSFAQDGPLDMRLDPSLPMTADAWIRGTDDRALEAALQSYGELPRARAATRAIRRAASEHHPLTTRTLREALQPIYPGPSRPRRIAQAFQALRIAVNHELEELSALLEIAARVVLPGGTLCVIAYHSLEDRMVKTAIRPPRPMDAWVEPTPSPWVPLTPRPIRPSVEEVRLNPRASSARLRAARRKETGS
ncbi:MAG: 16S rRNA (cytosine(1402)-N(4))-methyltransferase RsmH [Candidatus Eisenbacteria bacterium]|uniref:Ribosomal RNA small subunit methyltransferase H n=1 Tax=Eiseniibacteriota bacterium TaxID=2212470 RepID=A0A538TMA7_UNCEI|nr:MAG: 16S rRNA (cytosine(1402)-N(4))-methyltransferase RsmH [Candidatus Eisenbacteria bacterium]